MEILRKQNERMSKQVADLTLENRRLAEPLQQALADVAEFKRQLQNYEKDKLSLAVSSTKLPLYSVSILGKRNDFLLALVLFYYTQKNSCIDLTKKLLKLLKYV